MENTQTINLKVERKVFVNERNESIPYISYTAVVDGVPVVFMPKNEYKVYLKAYFDKVLNK